MSGAIIEVFEERGRWIVRFSENGEPQQAEFDMESHARSWAAGQTTRLLTVIAECAPERR
jgi:hypothetical protein